MLVPLTNSSSSCLVYPGAADPRIYLRPAFPANRRFAAMKLRLHLMTAFAALLLSAPEGWGQQPGGMGNQGGAPNQRGGRGFPGGGGGGPGGGRNFGGGGTRG